MVQRRRRGEDSAKPVDLLAGLNPEQREVVLHDEGPSLVVAVAGAGKTTALVHRIAYLVRERQVPPHEILAVTFSKKAADEMNLRLRGLGIRDARVGTWHSVAWEILRDEMPHTREWEVDSKDRFRTIVKTILGFRGMDWKTADLTTVMSYIGICKARLAEPGSDKSEEIAQEFFDARPCTQRSPELLQQAYWKATEEQMQRRLLTFDDMLVGCWKVLCEEGIRAGWASRWRYVLQDEAQDENEAQHTIGEMLARDHRNYMVVGDPAQSIYGFRGAMPEKLLAFEKEWGARVIKMSRNYRSGDGVITHANGVIDSMDEGTHLGVKMIPERGCEARINLEVHDDMDEEGEEVAQALAEMNASGMEWRDMAVLYRTNAQSRGVEEACLTHRIPYVVLGGTNFYNRKEVKDLIAYLRVADGRDDFDAVRRCINAPFRFLGKRFVEKLEEEGDRSGDDWVKVVRSLAESSRAGLNWKQRTSANEWASLIDSIRASIKKRDEVTDLQVALTNDNPEDSIRHHMPAALLERVIKETEYTRYITRDEGAETVENNRVSNIRELVRAAEKFTTVREFLDYVDETIKAAEKAQKDEDIDRVTLCTLHRSKGLEWDAVFMTGANDKILPHGRAEDIGEERRLFYVGVTRARDYLRLSYVRKAAFGDSVMYLSPSKFLAEAGFEVDPFDNPDAMEAVS